MAAKEAGGNQDGALVLNTQQSCLSLASQRWSEAEVPALQYYSPVCQSRGLLS